MKSIGNLGLFLFCMVSLKAQTPFERVYTILNSKCQNAACHSATATDASASLKFDDSQTTVWSALYNATPGNAGSQAKLEKLVWPQHPYNSFLLRKIAGSSFDTDLAIDTTEGFPMKDINGQALSHKEIEFIRQWIMFGAKKTYTSNEPQPLWQLVSDYYDNPTLAFLPKPARPAAGTGLQIRMGPIFLPASSEQEYCQQQEINFPFPAEIDRIQGIMNQQSHHFLLFKFVDSAAAASTFSDRQRNMSLISVLNGNTSFDGDKYLTSAWQDDNEMILPPGTAIFWDQKTVLDMNYHIKNYSASAILPCDFYLNIYYEDRKPGTIEMKSHLVNNALLFLLQGNQQRDYDDQDNGGPKEIRYLWNLTSHAHKYGTDFDIYIRDTTGAITTKIYEGFNDYDNGGLNIGYYPWDHPSIEYWGNSLYPVHFGKHNGNKSGLVARTSWDVQQAFITFGFTSNDEMQLFYYMYTSQDPYAVNAINDDSESGIYFRVIPNPMNAGGKLVYTLENAANVEAHITDITGKTVAHMSQEYQDEGVHEITTGNEKLSAGIYLATLSINGVIYSQKFIVTD